MINKLTYFIRTTCTSIYTVEKVDLSLFLCLSVSPLSHRLSLSLSLLA